MRTSSLHHDPRRDAKCESTIALLFERCPLRRSTAGLGVAVAVIRASSRYFADDQPSAPNRTLNAWIAQQAEHELACTPCLGRQWSVGTPLSAQGREMRKHCESAIALPFERCPLRRSTSTARAGLGVAVAIIRASSRLFAEGINRMLEIRSKTVLPRKVYVGYNTPRQRSVTGHRT